MEIALKVILLSLFVILTIFIQSGFSIKCYECSSQYDPYCSDPFDNTSFALTDCDELKELDHLPGIRPTMCRKITQRVNGVWRYIRSCAYLGEPGIDGDGTCNTKDGCNTSSHLKVSPLLISVILSIFAVCKMV